MISARELADRLDLKRLPRSWRGRCPACSYAGNIFSIRERFGRVSLYCANGCSTEELAEAVDRVVKGWRPSPRVAAVVDGATVRQRKRELALALWNGSQPAPGTPADVYLTARGLLGLAASSALRYRGDTSHPEGGKLPALVALVCDVAGAPIAVHRTYLTRNGEMASAQPRKASLGSLWGGAIRLDSLSADKALVIAEGLESAASAGRLMGLPAWAAISAGNMAAGLVLPPEVGSIVIAADPDAPGEQAAIAAALRWRIEGRKVRIARPTGTGDFNDVLMARSSE